MLFSCLHICCTLYCVFGWNCLILDQINSICSILFYTCKNQTLTLLRTEWHVCMYVPGAVAYITAVSAGTERCGRKPGSSSGSTAESTSTPSSRASPRQACKRERESRQQCEIDAQWVWGEHQEGEIIKLCQPVLRRVWLCSPYICCQSRRRSVTKGQLFHLPRTRSPPRHERTARPGNSRRRASGSLQCKHTTTTTTMTQPFSPWQEASNTETKRAQAYISCSQTNCI